MTPQSELDLRELLAKATPGPWGYDSRPGTACHVWVPATKLTMVDGELAYKASREDIADLRTGTREEDAALIVALRNGADELLDEVERLRSELSEATGRQRVSLVDQSGKEVGHRFAAMRELLTEDAFVDEAGTVWTVPTAWAYFAACRARAALHPKEQTDAE